LSFLGRFYSQLRNSQLSHFNLFNDSQWIRHLDKFSLQLVYKKYYLSKDDIYLWDKICFFLRITKPLVFIYNRLLQKYLALAQKLLLQDESLDSGAGLLVVAKKIK
ncbi:MAG: hypothetical protein NT014_07700, partial [Candidatus Omnitrophica bacterium]|nr:hypothetical protein [Candidatus Omnitrophota bacterium]